MIGRRPSCLSLVPFLLASSLPLTAAAAAADRGPERDPGRCEGTGRACAAPREAPVPDAVPAAGGPDAIPLAPGAPGTRALPAVTRFVTPVDPWTPAGPGWGEPALRPDGSPLCETNHVPATACDPQGPRPFLHAGVDVLPAADRSVRASAPGLVVWARPAAAAFAGRRASEGGGTVILQHDLDGDAVTTDDLMMTVYGHVEPLAAEGRLVQEGEVIARTVAAGGGHLHFGVRRAAFSLLDPISHHAAFPPPGTDGCLPCYSRQAPLPPFPERWEDPATLFRAPTWARLLKSGQDQEAAGDVLAVEDGFVVAGVTLAANIGGSGNPDGWIARLDAEGEFFSQYAYGGDGPDFFHKLAATADGGFVTLGRSDSFPVLVKFGLGSELPEWQKRYAGSGLFVVHDVRVAADGGYAISGISGPFFGAASSVGVIRTDPSGEVLWSRSYAVPSSGYSVVATSIAGAPDGGLAIAAEVVHPFEPPGRSSHGLVFRLDQDGGVRWSNLLIGSANRHPRQIEAASDGFMVVGSILASGLWLARFLDDGSTDWEAAYHDGSSQAQFGERLILNPGGGFTLAGTTVSGIDHLGDPRFDALLLKVDGDGRILHGAAFDARGPYDSVLGLRGTRDGGIILVAQGLPCRACTETQYSRGLLVARTDEELRVTNGCGMELDAVRLNGSTLNLSWPVHWMARDAAAAPIDMALASTALRAHACSGGAFGPPPDIHSVSSGFDAVQTFCDVTEIFVAQLCANYELTGVRPTMPIVLAVTHDMLRLDALVTDDDSTPDRGDIERVEATILRDVSPQLSNLPLADDGSGVVELEAQRSFFFGGKNCFYDSFDGVCGCTQAYYPTASGDAAPADGVYSRDTGLLAPELPSDGIDCFLAARGRPFVHARPGEQLELRVRAIDLQGNVTTWPEPFPVTPHLNALTCSGDECGCCLLLNPGAPSTCAGKPGMTSPDFPQGLCHLF